MNSGHKSFEHGRCDYERSVANHPTNHDGTPRKSWEQLPPFAQWSWARGPITEGRTA